MWLFSFYRFYCACVFGLSVYFFYIRNVWVSILVIICFRVAWFLIERMIHRHAIRKDFTKHITDFKQQHGPYGIRIANKAEKEWQIKASLSEVFTPNIKKLQKTVEQLEMFDTLFKAGMRPQGDEYLLHDLKLKYGKERLQRKRSDEAAGS